MEVAYTTREHLCTLYFVERKKNNFEITKIES